MIWIVRPDLDVYALQDTLNTLNAEGFIVNPANIYADPKTMTFTVVGWKQTLEVKIRLEGVDTMISSLEEVRRTLGDLAHHIQTQP